METVLYILLVILLIMLLVILHEFGHFIVGKKSGIKVLEFSVGFGPKLLSRLIKGTKYSLRALPLGGFVRFLGEEGEEEDPHAFNNVSVGRRFLTVLAGPVMNILVAVILAVGFLTIYGDAYVVVDSVQAELPAEEAGLLPDDKIVALNGERIDFYTEFYLKFDELDMTEQMSITVLRGEEEKTFELTPQETENGRMIGVNLRYEQKLFGFFEAIWLSFKWIFIFMGQILSTLFKSISNLDSSQLSGIVGTVGTVSETIKVGGFENVLRIGALLSLNFGIFNLLPFPALDGGKLVFLGIEKLRGKPVSSGVEGIFNLVGIVLLIALMILLTYQDIVRLF